MKQIYVKGAITKNEFFWIGSKAIKVLSFYQKIFKQS